MDLLKEILANEVFPAIGCTEPISCAYAAAAATEQLPSPVEKIQVCVDPGTFKNGATITIPNSGGLKGNAIAAALGAVIARATRRLEILREVSPTLLEEAKALLDQRRLEYRCSPDQKSFHVEVWAEGGGAQVHCVISEGHTNITGLEKNGVSIIAAHPHAGAKQHAYRERLKTIAVEELLRTVIRLDLPTRAELQRGIAMNLAIADKGVALKRTAYQLEQMCRAGIKQDDLFYRVKLRVAAAVDARMGGLAEPVMTSGGSGNQGVLAILVPYLVGLDRRVPLATIEESIAISHAVNAYIKCFVGELSVLCGCAIAASIGAAIALVYQQAGLDMQRIAFAIDNVIGDLCGIICDGAKPGCSMKIVSGADTVIRSAFMALAGYGLSTEDGVLGHSPEESIRNLSRISLEGMGLVDPTVVHILEGKAGRPARG